MAPLDVSVYVITILFLANVFLAATVVFFERRNPASTWAWLFVLFFIPVFGFFIYLLFGRNTSKEKAFAQKAEDDYGILLSYISKNPALEQEIEGQLFSYDGIYLDGEYSHLKDFVTLNINSGSWLTYNNSMTHFIDGTKKFQALIADIRGAKKFIHLQYYILRGDTLGKQIVAELAQKAKEGIEVRLLYDYMGNIFLQHNFFQPLILAGGEVKPFVAPRFLRINCRNHRKLSIIDGEISYVGGFNIGDEYLGRVKRFGHWRDTHVRFKGDVVDQMQLRFIMDWNYASTKKLELCQAFFPAKKDLYGNLPVQIVCSGPDTQWRNVKNSYFKMINEAEKTILIETPYFSPDDDVQTSLKVAALSGIDVRIIIPGKPDHPFVYWSSMSYLGELLDAGVKCYQYEAGFIHSKTVFVDGLVATVGTANMDVRSFGLNFEINSFIYHPETVALLEKDFQNDLKDCIEITKEWYEKRSLAFKFKEAISRLISPIL